MGRVLWNQADCFSLRRFLSWGMAQEHWGTYCQTCGQPRLFVRDSPPSKAAFNSLVCLTLIVLTVCGGLLFQPIGVFFVCCLVVVLFAWAIDSLTASPGSWHCTQCGGPPGSPPVPTTLAANPPPPPGPPVPGVWSEIGTSLAESCVLFWRWLCRMVIGCWNLLPTRKRLVGYWKRFWESL